jgi:hypothetical protein
MQFFYDGQIRRYISQIIRAFSYFQYRDSDGNLTNVPVLYGDLTRQVSNIMRDNSENKMPSAPRMAVYITALEMDRTRLSDSSFVSKVNVREREWDPIAKEYKTTQGNGYTVERLHPTPYNLSVNVDLWTTNTEQKLQIMEQILMIFNPDLELQTSDNYVDWTSLTVLNMDSLTFSSRSIPTGTESDIDVATMAFTAPIYISPPAKVKKLGVITSIITSVFNVDTGTVELDGFNPDTGTDVSNTSDITVLPDGSVINDGQTNTGNGLTDLTDPSNTVIGVGANTVEPGTVAPKDGLVKGEFDDVIVDPDDDSRPRNVYGVSSDTQLTLKAPLVTTYRNLDIIIDSDTAKLSINKKLRIGEVTWLNVIEAEEFATYQEGISQIRLKRAELINPIVGTFTINASDKYTLDIEWDVDTLPTDTLIPGIARSANDEGTIDYIINPRTFNPITHYGATKSDIPLGARLLMLAPIGGKVERKQSFLLPDNTIDTETDFDAVYGHDIFVNGVKVTSTAINKDDKYVIKLDDVAPADVTVRYVLYLNEDGADAWKSVSGDDFIADHYDIVEWDGSKWNIVFDASESTETVYITNLTTNTQYYFNSYFWQKAIDGYYSNGTWDLVL